MTLSRINQAGLAASDPLLLWLDGAGKVGGDTAQQLRKSGPWANALYDPKECLPIRHGSATSGED